MHKQIKVYYLSTCDTCKRIIKEIEPLCNLEKQDIKVNPVSNIQLDELYRLSKSYEALFSKSARKYKELDLKNKTLTENDFKKFILEDYTFLKRPVFVFENNVFIGNSKSTLTELKQKING